MDGEKLLGLVSITDVIKRLLDKQLTETELMKDFINSWKLATGRLNGGLAGKQAPTTFHHLDLSKKLDASLIEEFPRLKKFIDNVTALPVMVEYLQASPSLIEVGLSPKLVFEGVAHPTGVQKTQHTLL